MSDTAKQTSSQRTITGRVVSDRMDKTVTVSIERLERHSLYGKYIRRSSKLHVHDENNDCKSGDLVSIMQCRPLSKKKTWTLAEILERAKG